MNFKWKLNLDYFTKTFIKNKGENYTLDEINSIIHFAPWAVKVVIHNDLITESVFTPKQYKRLREVVIKHESVIEVLKEDLAWDKLLTKRERYIAIQTIARYPKHIVEAFKSCNLSNKERFTLLKALLKTNYKDLHLFIKDRGVHLNDKDVKMIADMVISKVDWKCALHLLRYRFDKLSNEQKDILDSIAVAHQLAGGTIIV